MIKGALGRQMTVDMRMQKERRPTVASSKYSSIVPHCRRRCGGGSDGLGRTAAWRAAEAAAATAAMMAAAAAVVVAAVAASWLERRRERRLRRGGGG